MTRILRYLADHALAAIALICSLLALASASYAAFMISGSQITNHSIDPVKLDPKFINGNVRAWAVIGPSGRLIAGAGGPAVSSAGFSGQYDIDWRAAVTRRCATEATVDGISSKPTESVTTPQGTESLVAGYASGATSAFFNHRTKRRAGRTIVQTFDQQGRPAALGFDVAVVC